MIGERIRLSRESCGLTQQELAAAAGMTQSALSQIEAGRVLDSSTQNIEAISLATGYPMTFFDMGPLPDLPQGNYRKLARGDSKIEKQVRGRVRHIVEIVQRAEQSLRLPHVAISAVSQLDGLHEIEPLVMEVRNALGVDSLGPILNLMRAIERSGVVVVRLPIEMEGHDGFSAWPDFGLDEARPIIALTGDHPGDRDRFSIAHELGHLILHSARRGVDPKQAESEAHRFAGALLLPEEAATEAMRSRITLRSLMDVKATYGISMAAATMRALDLRIISRAQRDAIFRQLTTRGWRTQEPVVVEREQPVLISKIINTLAGSGSTSERAKRLGMPVFAFHALASSG